MKVWPTEWLGTVYHRGVPDSLVLAGSVTLASRVDENDNGLTGSHIYLTLQDVHALPEISFSRNSY